ncbi:signal peptidase I [Lujinxingia vulgaris]|uniref:Signal peptidase I n=2 Tax=Lujinxingia vulgaris TaxID=2600176 RepID=A0A5C6XRV0_9DELT|nr:signal peptidase I [Lujinxingia vulgaris]
MLISLAISLGLTLVMIASMWKIFTKAGEPGWAAIVPVYNGIVLAKICGKEPWWGILLIVPFANLVAMIILSLALAEAFGKDTVWGLGLILLPIVFYPMLAFGNAQYQGRRAMPAGAY